jgi:RNA-binding protein 39
LSSSTAGRSRSSSSDRSLSRSPSQHSRSKSRSPTNDKKRRSRSHGSSDDDGGDSKKSRSASTITSGAHNNTTSTTTIANGKLTKDQRTIFVSQLVMKTEERDIKKYFRKKLGCKVNDVQLLRDRRTGRHKGCAYVELGRLEDVRIALAASGSIPGFQRFPILVKASEAEKNYGLDGGLCVGGSIVGGATTMMTTTSTVTAQFPLSSSTASAPAATIMTGSTISSNGLNKRIEAQKVYIGNIDRNVTQAQLYTIFCQFGDLEKVTLQVDTATGISKGYAFLSFKDPKVANLAIQCMAGQVLASRPMHYRSYL